MGSGNIKWKWENQIQFNKAFNKIIIKKLILKSAKLKKSLSHEKFKSRFGSKKNQKIQY